MANTSGFTRPKSARDGYPALELQNRSGYDYRFGTVIEATVTSANFSGWGGVETYTDMIDDSVTVVCSGVVEEFGTNEFIGILVNDTEDATTGLFATEFNAIRLPINTGVSPAVGETLYWDQTNQELTTTSASNTKCAIVLEAKETLAANNARKLPAADWVLVSISKMQ